MNYIQWLNYESLHLLSGLKAGGVLTEMEGAVKALEHLCGCLWRLRADNSLRVDIPSLTVTN